MTALVAISQESIFLALLMGALAFFLVGNLIIAGLWIVGALRGRSYLAPKWSGADLFLGGQGVLALVLFAACAGWSVVTLGRLGSPLSGSKELSGAGFYLAVLLPFWIQQLALVMIPIGFIRWKYQASLRELGLSVGNGRLWRQIAAGVGLALLLLPFSSGLEQASRWLIVESGWIPYGAALVKMSEEADALKLLSSIRHDVPTLTLLGLLIGVIGPVAEEIFFRGFAYGILRRRFGLYMGMTLSALLFAAIHCSPTALVPIFVLGMAMAWLYERTGSLAAPIALHCANNLAALLNFLVVPGFSFWHGWPGG